jgi:hypothetical protein
VIKAVTVSRAIIERLLWLQKLQGVALAAFGPGDPKDRLRASEVAKHVARELGREDSGHFRHDLAQALAAAGWRSVNLGNRRCWKGMRAL